MTGTETHPEPVSPPETTGPHPPDEPVLRVDDLHVTFPGTGRGGDVDWFGNIDITVLDIKFDRICD